MVGTSSSQLPVGDAASIALQMVRTPPPIEAAAGLDGHAPNRRRPERAAIDRALRLTVLGTYGSR
jgi:hypothetical protein